MAVEAADEDVAYIMGCGGTGAAVSPAAAPAAAAAAAAAAPTAVPAAAPTTPPLSDTPGTELEEGCVSTPQPTKSVEPCAKHGVTPVKGAAEVVSPPAPPTALVAPAAPETNVYEEEQFQFCLASEALRPVKGSYMCRQPDLSARMRCILVDWMVEVQLKLRLLQDTLFIAVDIVDRFLSTGHAVYRGKLQLIGVTALHIACKFEEIYPPVVRDLVHISARAFTHQEILDMEVQVLVGIQFRVYIPTAWTFLRHFWRQLGISEAARLALLSTFFAERMLQEDDMLAYPARVVGAAALVLAQRSMRMPEWVHPCVERSLLAPCMRDMHSALVGASTAQMQAVRKKYNRADRQTVVSQPLTLDAGCPPESAWGRTGVGLREGTPAPC